MIHGILENILGLGLVHRSGEVGHRIFIITTLIVNVAEERVDLADVLIVRSIFDEAQQLGFGRLFVAALEINESQTVARIHHILPLRVVLDVGFEGLGDALGVVLVEISEGDAVLDIILISGLRELLEQGLIVRAAVVEFLHFELHAANKETQALFVGLGE